MICQDFDALIEARLNFLYFTVPLGNIIPVVQRLECVVLINLAVNKCFLYFGFNTNISIICRGLG